MKVYLQEILYQSSNQETFAIFRCRHAVVIMQTLLLLDQSQYSLFMTVRHIFEISEDDHPRTVSHARDHW